MNITDYSGNHLYKDRLCLEPTCVQISRGLHHGKSQLGRPKLQPPYCSIYAFATPNLPTNTVPTNIA